MLEKFQRLKNMLYTAEAKNIRISPRKVRLIADAVRGKKLNHALSRLSILNKRASTPVKKTIESAIANAINNFKAKREDLTLKSIVVNEGTMLKRYHFAARGRVRPYKRRTSHIKVVIEGKDIVKVVSKPKIEKEKEEENGSKS